MDSSIVVVAAAADIEIYCIDFDYEMSSSSADIAAAASSSADTVVVAASSSDTAVAVARPSAAVVASSSSETRHRWTWHRGRPDDQTRCGGSSRTRRCPCCIRPCAAAAVSEKHRPRTSYRVTTCRIPLPTIKER